MRCARSPPLAGAAKPATFAADRPQTRRAAARAARTARGRAGAGRRRAAAAGAPFGTVEVNVEGCTLCLSCVSACPTGALSDDPERPMLRFAEDACVQCGLCKATCPEKVITLKPQIDFRAATAMSRVIKQEEPCRLHPLRQAVRREELRSSASSPSSKASTGCIKDSKKRLDVIKMCDDCRVEAMAEEQFDPFGAPQRPPVRTTDDYLREREEKGES